MSLAYPVARSLEEALKPGRPAARSRQEALALAGGLALEGLETSWVHLPPHEAEALFRAAGAEGAAGHLQRYEDTSGHVVIAVSWWRLVDPAAARPAAPAASAGGDHTDDLYFRTGRTKPKRARKTDPRQLDLFGARED
jgi:hypothetical protein